MGNILNPERLREAPVQIMGILNATPDSFSDGGMFQHRNTALAHAKKMLAEGANIIDIGGESTRPGADEVSVQDELARVIPLISELKSLDTLVSVDTSKAEVMQAAIEAGADMINDVRALREKNALEVVANSEVDVCLMHMQGAPRVMQDNPTYRAVVDEVRAFLLERTQACMNAGISSNRICWDPGFGFGKTLEHNCTLMADLEIFTTEYPVLVGVSRKSMIGALTGKEVNERLVGSVVAAGIAASKGARILRVHDVKETVDAVKIAQAFKKNK